MDDSNYQTAGNYSNHFNQFTPTVFSNPLFGNLIVIKDNKNNLWFVGMNAASMLGYQDTTAAIRDLVPQCYKQIVSIKDLGGVLPPNPLGGSQKRTIINEQGLMALITHSRLNNAEVIEFQHWLYDVAVSMRQYGVAVSDQMKTVMELDPYKLHDIAQQRLNENAELQEKLKMQQAEMEEIQSQLDYYKIMVSPEGLISSTGIAKDYGLSGKMLNMVLRKLSIIYFTNNGFELSNEFAKAGFFAKKCNTPLPNGSVSIHTYWTEAGRDLIYSILKANKFELGNNQKNIQLANEIISKPTL